MAPCHATYNTHLHSCPSYIVRHAPHTGHTRATIHHTNRCGRVVRTCRALRADREGLSQQCAHTAADARCVCARARACASACACACVSRDLDLAEALYERAVYANPRCAKALSNLARLSHNHRHLYTPIPIPARPPSRAPVRACCGWFGVCVSGCVCVWGGGGCSAAQPRRSKQRGAWPCWCPALIPFSLPPPATRCMSSVRLSYDVSGTTTPSSCTSALSTPTQRTS